MATNRKNSKLAKTASRQNEVANSFSPLEKFVINIDRSAERERPHVNLKYYHSEYQCFSEWTADQMKLFSSFVNKLRQTTWNQIYRSGGQLGHKSGFGYTPCKDRKKLPKYPELDAVSEDITFFELRVDDTMRVHGFRILDAFYLVWLDHTHKMYS